MPFCRRCDEGVNFEVALHDYSLLTADYHFHEGLHFFLSPFDCSRAGFHIGCNRQAKTAPPAAGIPIVARYFGEEGQLLPLSAGLDYGFVDPWSAEELDCGLELPPRTKAPIAVRHRSFGSVPALMMGQRPTCRCRRFVAIRLHLEGPGYLFLVRHGVLLARVECDLGAPGAFAVVADDQVKTDLSGLQPVHDSVLDELVASVRQTVAEQVETVLRLTRDEGLFDGNPMV